MVEIIGVRFNSAGKVYYFDPKGEIVDIGMMVVVETSRGLEVGKVSIPNREVADSEITLPLKEIIRIATDKDMKQFQNNKEKEKEAFKIASGLINDHKLEMKLIQVEYTFDGSKILFYFTADGRIDFRDLVKSLAGVFKTRIELRQIGVRDEARQLGSLGICGRFLCCSTFLDDFRPVSIKMAKEQGLSLNPTKISGVCGRLMCCLQYEQSTYEEELKTMPQRGATVETLDGRGYVVDTATLKQQIRVKLESEKGHKTEYYKVGEFNVVGKKPTVSLEELKIKKKEEELNKDLLIDQVETPSVEKKNQPEKQSNRSRNSKRRTNNRRRGSDNKPKNNEGQKSSDETDNKPKANNPEKGNGSSKPNSNPNQRKRTSRRPNKKVDGTNKPINTENKKPVNTEKKKPVNNEQNKSINKETTAPRNGGYTKQ